VDNRGSRPPLKYTQKVLSRFRRIHPCADGQHSILGEKNVLRGDHQNTGARTNAHTRLFALMAWSRRFDAFSSFAAKMAEMLSGSETCSEEVMQSLPHDVRDWRTVSRVWGLGFGGGDAVSPA
jgi:hypothetical protein